MPPLLGLLDSCTRTVGENGAAEHTSEGVGNNLLCLFIKLIRDVPKRDLIDRMYACKSDDVNNMLNLLILWWHTRATRQIGKGERRLFYDMIPILIDLVGIEPIIATIHLIPHYGYFKDYCYILDMNIHESLNQKIVELYTEQLRKDEEDMEDGKMISLAAKYAPSEKTQFDRHAKIFAHHMFETDCLKQYRQLKSKLNAYLRVPEVFMSSNRFAEINFKHISSLCLNRNRRAFLNITKIGVKRKIDSGRELCRQNLIDCDKVHGTEMSPHEIVKKFMYSAMSEEESKLLEKQWKSLIENIKQNGGVISNAIAMADVSGSMCGRPMEVSIALSLIVAELSESVFRNRILTFDTNPCWIVLDEHESLKEKVKKIQYAGWGGSTNFRAAFELILEQAKIGELSSSEFPTVFFVFSDMQFDAASSYCHDEKTHLESYFENVGKEICGSPFALPRIVFWNLRGSTLGFQSKANDSNVQELSGFNPSLLKYVTNLTLDTMDNIAINETPTPSDTLDAILTDDAFLAVRYAISDLNCGKLASYKLDCESQNFSEKSEEDDDFVIID